MDATLGTEQEACSDTEEALGYDTDADDDDDDDGRVDDNGSAALRVGAAPSGGQRPHIFKQH